jgi:ABC-type thiamine transport system ATPase subunit
MQYMKRRDPIKKKMFIDLFTYRWDFIILVRRNETICCLIGFGIGVGCCILYRLISNFLTPSSSTTSISNNSLSSLSNNKRDVSSNSHLPLLMKLRHVYIL